MHLNGQFARDYCLPRSEECLVWEGKSVKSGIIFLKLFIQLTSEVFFLSIFAFKQETEVHILFALVTSEQHLTASFPRHVRAYMLPKDRTCIFQIMTRMQQGPALLRCAISDTVSDTIYLTCRILLNYSQKR